MNKVTQYIKDSYLEITKEVTWPTWETLQQSTMVVLFATLLITVIVWLMDTGSAFLLKFVYSIFK